MRGHLRCVEEGAARGGCRRRAEACTMPAGEQSGSPARTATTFAQRLPVGEECADDDGRRPRRRRDGRRRRPPPPAAARWSGCARVAGGGGGGGRRGSAASTELAPAAASPPIPAATTSRSRRRRRRRRRPPRPPPPPAEAAPRRERALLDRLIKSRRARRRRGPASEDDERSRSLRGVGRAAARRDRGARLGAGLPGASRRCNAAGGTARAEAKLYRRARTSFWQALPLGERQSLFSRRSPTSSRASTSSRGRRRPSLLALIDARLTRPSCRRRRRRGRGRGRSGDRPTRSRGSARARPTCSGRPTAASAPTARRSPCTASTARQGRGSRQVPAAAAPSLLASLSPPPPSPSGIALSAHCSSATTPSSCTNTRCSDASDASPSSDDRRRRHRLSPRSRAPPTLPAHPAAAPCAPARGGAAQGGGGAASPQDRRALTPARVGGEGRQPRRRRLRLGPRAAAEAASRTAHARLCALLPAGAAAEDERSSPSVC